MVDAFRTPAVSVTKRVGAGGRGGPAARAAARTKRRRTASARGAFIAVVFSELDGGDLLRPRGGLEVRPLLEAGDVRDDHRRERAPERVVGLRHLVEAPPLDRDPVLRPFELGLKVGEA